MNANMNHTPATASIDWQGWMQSWDDQQRGYLPDREARFAAMLNVLGELLPPDFVALDLACGPGSISQRLLERFPQARCIAVDLDPVLIALGRNVLGDHGGRLQWHELDLRDPAWIDALGETKFHAVVSTTALHWLPVTDLVRVYHQVGSRVHSGGVLLNGDHMKFSHHLPAFRQVAEAVRRRHWADESFAAKGLLTWEQWWQRLQAEPGLEALFAERASRFSWRSPDNWLNPLYDLHEAALREAGFREVETIWRNMDNHVLMAVK